MDLKPRTIDELEIEDERSFRHVELYERLKEALRKDRYTFLAPPRGEALSWDRALFLNLTFWSPAAQGDVLASDRIPADVVIHVAWHHLARRALGAAAATADGLFLGEAVASASDLYLVGRLLGHAPDSSFLETQVPALAQVAEANGLDEAAFEALLEEVAREPERAFEDLRALLFDAATSLVGCATALDAERALSALETRRFAPLLHHYELSNWVLYARAHAKTAPDAAVRALDRAIRESPDAVAFLEATWLR